MWPGRFCVHVGRPGSSVFESYLHILLHLWNRIYFNLQQVLYKHSFLGTFFQVHPSLNIFSNEVVNLLIVDLDKTATNEVSFGGIILSHSYYLLKCSRNDPASLLTLISSHHSVGLTTTCLSICKNCTIVPFKNVVYQWEGTLFVDEKLRTFYSKNVIKSEVFWQLFAILLFETD